MPRHLRAGWGLVIGGAVVAAVFLIFIMTMPQGGSADASPLWVCTIWALLTMCWGFIRVAIGPSRLDRRPYHGRHGQI